MIASLSVSAAGEGRLHTLRRMRQDIAHRMDTCKSPRDFATLAVQMRAVLAEIDELAAILKGTMVPLTYYVGGGRSSGPELR